MFLYFILFVCAKARTLMEAVFYIMQLLDYINKPRRVVCINIRILVEVYSSMNWNIEQYRKTLCLTLLLLALSSFIPTLTNTKTLHKLLYSVQHHFNHFLNFIDMTFIFGSLHIVKYFLSYIIVFISLPISNCLNYI